MTETIEHKYSIAEFSALFDLKPSTLRFYEKEELIKPQRSANGHRFYVDADVQWMKFLEHLKGTGMSIIDLKKYVAWRSQGDQTIPERLELLRATKQNFLKQLNEVQHHLQILNDKINWYEGKQAGMITEDESFAAYLAKMGHHE
ncbi:MerR family transcriptional regulator [Lactobacillus sp. ESL0703]|uniref:MerR family transcriptional regulator n=1 Tax=Lactobacillus sp. ESL0703 TaxID=2983218 RepID=UPI0023F9211D|nr:MerR family transcriptional regulator [Lactobacillus sp. ESL0703]MDF7668483.1 MerR family transcriptional regulator [Lactobacillus sp. ESL0703]